MNEEQTPVKQLILETALMTDPVKPEAGEQLEQWGMIERSPKAKRFKRLTAKGIKKALNISLAMEGDEGK